ncbi:MAG: DUF2807 domain-containing protein [Polaribacter sp.]|jgi:hypothetical protein|nr:head GIN domain-containing protein [Polaribacter sp.]MDB4010776.1 DUF2807 domain-containing protein [Polaribacter sp.]MDB4182518.1 DUF2807 domain-containing protein [Polaribacter sp.]MDG1221853.1 DUF2807 domain-containing protein [Polaribacter sp.]
MKTKTTKLAFVFLMTVVCTSCVIEAFNGIKGDRNVVTENRKITEDFTAIRTSTGLDVNITQENQNAVIVEADENLQNLIVTEVENGVLKIYSEKNIWSAKSKKVHVSIKTLNSLKASSGSDVRTVKKIQSEEISIGASSGASVRMTVVANSIATNTSSGATIRVSGSADNHAAKASSGSSIKAYDLISKNVIVNVSSGANIDIHASEKIEARASSGGDIDYKGTPKKVLRRSSSGGSISDK